MEKQAILFSTVASAIGLAMLDTIRRIVEDALYVYGDEKYFDHEVDMTCSIHLQRRPPNASGHGPCVFLPAIHPRHKFSSSEGQLREVNRKIEQAYLQAASALDSLIWDYGDDGYERMLTVLEDAYVLTPDGLTWAQEYARKAKQS